MWIRDDGGHTINTRHSFESKGHFSDQEFANHPRTEYNIAFETQSILSVIHLVGF